MKALVVVAVAACALVIAVGTRVACGCMGGASKQTIAYGRADLLAAHAADLWTRSRSCPTADADSDPWGNPWRVSCDDTGATVRSAGPDGRFGTPDDIFAGRR